MNKTELINSMLRNPVWAKKQWSCSERFIASVEEALKKGDKVVLVGFGTFEVKNRAARKGRNPQTKEEITIPHPKLLYLKQEKD